MNVLLTNDDGIFSKGILALYDIFSQHHSVTVVAPDSEKSAVGHGLTLTTPIRARQITMKNGKSGYAVGGTPADCIKLSMLDLLTEKPDIVISGINRGANTGVNINYSGTAAGAREATLYKIPAIAVSVKGISPQSYSEAAQFIHGLSLEVLQKGLPEGSFLNVNLPDKPLKDVRGIKICKQSQTFPDEYTDKRKDPRGINYYWHGCEFTPLDEETDVDSMALEEDYITVTPIQCDMTNYKMMKSLEAWDMMNMTEGLKN